MNARWAGMRSLRIALGYATVATLWIVFLEATAHSQTGTPLSALEMVLEGGFVLATSAVLYLLLERDARRHVTLSSEHQMLAYLANHSNDILLIEDDRGRVVAANDRALEAYDTSREELLGRQFVSLCVPEARAAFPADRARVATTGNVLYETEHQSRRGRRFNVEVSARRVAIGGQTFVHNSVRDLSRYWREQQWLKLFFDLPFVGMAITSPETRRWLRVNDELCRMLGYPRESLERMTWTEVTHPDDLDIDVTEFEQVLAGRRDGYRLRKRFIRADGTIMHAAIDVRCARRVDGSIEIFIATVQDISELVRSEDALSRSRDLYAMLSGTNEVAARARDEHELLSSACTIAVQTGGFGLAVAHLVDESGELQQTATYTSEEFEQHLASFGLADIREPARMALAADGPWVCNDLGTREHDATWVGRAAGEGVTSVAAHPLRRDGRTIGALTVYALESGFFNTEILQTLAHASENLSYTLDAIAARRARDLANLEIAASNLRLQSANQRLSSLIASSPAAIFDLDPSGCVRSIWNRAAEEITGVPANEAIGRPLPIHPDGREHRNSLRRRVFGGETVHGEQITRRLRDGRIVHFNASASPIRDATGKIEAVLVIVVDITRQVRAQEALSASERTYRLLFDRHPEPMWVFDLETLRVLAVNDAAVDAYGYTREEFLELSIDQLRPEEEVPRLREHLRQQDGVLRHSGRWRHRRKDGSIIDVEIDWHLLEFEGRRARLVMATNVTERVRAEQALHESESRLKALNAELEDRISARTAELLAAKERAEAADHVKSVFLATVSHELRTPLNSIIGFSDLMLQGLTGPLSPEQAKQLGIVNASGRHLLSLVSDFLDISKIEAGALTLDLRPVNLCVLLRDEEPAYRKAAQDKGLRYVHVRCSSAWEVVADARRVRQVVHNLISNAIKFTESGQVTLTVEPTGSKVRVTVADTGIGIARNDIERLFEPFRQIDQPAHKNREGTGLGLAIARSLVRAMGGEIGVDSQPGAGSRFWFTLPLSSQGNDPCAS